MTKTANISAETSESIKAIETLFNNGWNLDQLRHFDGFEIWHAQKMAEASTARERLAAKMAPAYEALGIVASTSAGRMQATEKLAACFAVVSSIWKSTKCATGQPSR